ncbi:MAG: hypothetical protein V5A20_02140 [Salinibacter sp.]|uniref:hypothetical protein n=1 Tax=Salinibacter sp. TaxID=2065818 RepID=UPI002FC3358A
MNRFALGRWPPVPVGRHILSLGAVATLGTVAVPSPPWTGGGSTRSVPACATLLPAGRPPAPLALLAWARSRLLLLLHHFVGLVALGEPQQDCAYRGAARASPDTLRGPQPSSSEKAEGPLRTPSSTRPDGPD